MLLVMVEARTLMAAVGKAPGAIAIVALLLVAGLTLLGLPLFAWRSATAAAASGLYREARIAYRSASFMLGFAGYGLAAFGVGTVVLLAWSLGGRVHFPSPARIVFGLPVLAGAAFTFLSLSWAAHTRARSVESLGAVLPERPRDRVLVYLFDLLDAALEAAPKLGAGERVLYAAKGLVLTTQRVLGAEKEPALTSDERAVLDYLAAGELPEDEAREAVRDVARRFLEEGEELLAVAPARLGVLRWNAKLPSRDSGTAVTDRRILTFGPRAVRAQLPLGGALSVRQVIGAEPPFLELVVRSGRSKLRFAARPLDAAVLLRGLLADDPEAIFLPSFLANV
jgi:hypothetical protein